MSMKNILYTCIHGTVWKLIRFFEDKEFEDNGYPVYTDLKWKLLIISRTGLLYKSETCSTKQTVLIKVKTGEKGRKYIGCDCCPPCRLKKIDLDIYEQKKAKMFIDLHDSGFSLKDIKCKCGNNDLCLIKKDIDYKGITWYLSCNKCYNVFSYNIRSSQIARLKGKKTSNSNLLKLDKFILS